MRTGIPPALVLAICYLAGYFMAGAIMDGLGLVGPDGPRGFREEERLAAAVLGLAAALALFALAALRLWPGSGVRPLWVVPTCCCFLMCGMARGIHTDAIRYTARLQLDIPAGSGSVDARAFGAVTSFPRELQGGSRFVMELRALESGGRRRLCTRPRPRVLVTVRPSVEVLYGDLLRVEGVLSLPTGARNPGGFDYKGYLSSRGIDGTLKARSPQLTLLGEGHGLSLLARFVGPVRRMIGEMIERRLEGEPRALLRGLLLGDRSELGCEVRESMARAGVVHIMAVSGLHVGMVALLFASAARLLGLAGLGVGLSSVAGATLYCAVVGFPASACRAVAMLACYVLCRRLQRPAPARDSVAVAAFCLSIARPAWVATPGFQLSFAAVAGVIAFRDCLIIFAERIGIMKSATIKKALVFFGASLGASISSWPIVAIHFGGFPVLFLLGNAFAIPLVGVVLAWGLAGVLLGMLSPLLSDLMFAADWAAVTPLLWGSDLVASIPWASLPVADFSPLLAAAYLLGLAGAYLFRGWRRVVLVAGVCIISAYVIVHPRGGAAGGTLEVIFLDVGHGDACVVLTPSGLCMLVDAGPATSNWDSGRDVIVPFMRARGLKGIDRAVISHGDADHWGGLHEVSRRLGVREVVVAGSGPLGGLADLLPKLESGGAVIRGVQAGDSLEPLDGLECLVIHPSREFESKWGSRIGERLNDRSVVLRARYGEVSFLLTGDIEEAAESWILSSGAPLDCAVLKVPHHGSDTSSGMDFIRKAAPLVAVISCGPRELFNLPKPSVLARYDSLSAATALTARDGAVVVRTDGERIEVRSHLAPERPLAFDGPETAQALPWHVEGFALACAGIIEYPVNVWVTRRHEIWVNARPGVPEE